MRSVSEVLPKYCIHEYMDSAPSRSLRSGTACVRECVRVTIAQHAGRRTSGSSTSRRACCSRARQRRRRIPLPSRAHEPRRQCVGVPAIQRAAQGARARIGERQRARRRVARRRRRQQRRPLTDIEISAEEARHRAELGGAERRAVAQILRGPTLRLPQRRRGGAARRCAPARRRPRRTGGTQAVRPKA
jgi:hypothetical protein